MIKEKVRVGVDATPMLEPRSGVGYYTSRLLSSLLHNSKGWEFHLFSNRDLGNLEPPLDRAMRPQRYFGGSRWLWLHLILPAIVRRRRLDLCHYTNAVAPLWQSVPYILTIHDASLFLQPQHHPRARHLTMRLFLPWVARRAAAIITVSEHARRDLLHILRLPPEKVRVVYEAAPQWFRPVLDAQKKQHLREKYKLPEQFILYVGTLEPRKNLHRLIQALSKVHQSGFKLPLILAGARGWMMEDFERRVAALQLQRSVRYLGYVPTADLPGLYSLCTIFAFPSLYEGFGLPPLEAMACGAPVLTSNRSSLQEICGEAALLVNPLCVDDIAAGIRTLLDDRELRLELSHRGQQRARSFSWARAAQETTAVYNQALAAA